MTDPNQFLAAIAEGIAAAALKPTSAPDYRDSSGQMHYATTLGPLEEPIKSFAQSLMKDEWFAARLKEKLVNAMDTIVAAIASKIEGMVIEKFKISSYPDQWGTRISDAFRPAITEAITTKLREHPEFLANAISADTLGKMNIEVVIKR